jgi:hypothetical protein
MGSDMTRFNRVVWFAAGVFVVWMTAMPVLADLQFVEPAVHAGTVRTGAPLHHTFSFVNAGPEDVEILEIQPSCGCSRPKIAQNTYRPGEKGKIDLEVNTLSQAPGQRSWTVQIKYRRGMAIVEVTLQLGARMVREVMVQPTALVVFAEHAAEHPLTVTDARTIPLTVRQAILNSPGVTAALSEPMRDPQGRTSQRVTLKVAPDYPPGRHQEELHLYTNDAPYPELKVPVTIIRVDNRRLTAAPQEVQLNGPTGSPLPSRLIRIRDNQDSEVVIAKIVVDEPAVVCRWARGPGNQATLKVQVDGKLFHDGELHTTVHVDFQKPPGETLSFPVHVFLRKSDE